MPYRSGIISEIDEFAFLNYSSDKRKHLQVQVGVVLVMYVLRVQTLERSNDERDNCLVEIHHSCLGLLYLLEDRLYAMKKSEVVTFDEVDLTLAPVDFLEPDLVLELDSTDGREEIPSSEKVW